MSNLHKLAFVAVLLSLGACSRMSVIPEEPPASTGPVVIPPVSDGSMPPPSTQPLYPTQPGAGAMHVVQPGETLYRIGTRYGYDYRQIAAWNNIPPPYTLSVGQQLIVSPPAGGVPSYGQTPVYTQPAVTAPAPTVSGAAQYHTVSRGETLYSISRLYGRSFQELAAWNNIPPPYALSVGQTLVVSPTAGGMTMIQPVQPPIVPFQPPVTSAPVTGGTAYHTVSAGETLYSIARRYGRHYTEIASWNNIQPPYTLNVGQQLRVSAATMGAGSYYRQSAVPPAVSGGTRYVVRRGDTLHDIAQRHGRDYREIAAWNNLSPPYKLYVGQNLAVGAAVSAPPVQPAPAAMTYNPANYTAAGANSGMKTYHIVQKGESLAMIAQRYSQTPLDLALWNGIKPPYQLEPGQSLLVGK